MNSKAMNQRDKIWIPTIVGLSIAIPLAVLALMLMPSSWRIETGIEPQVLPLFHAVLNGTTAVLLVMGVIFIKNKQVNLHRASMVTALLLSAVFLISYVISKLSHDPVPFGGLGWLRNVYFFILISHILLSVPVLPLALMSVYRAFNNELDKHRKLVRWTFPIWLYVAVTGVLVYLFMAPYYV
jgi:putative membrane protein